MKIRIADRVLVALSGLILIALSACLVAQMFFAVPMTDMLMQMLDVKTTANIVMFGAIALVMLLLGVYCLCMLFRRGRGKRGFVQQKTENGEISISIRAMETLVQKCVDKHDEIHVLGTGLATTRDGLVIKLRIGLASGVSIPLAVSSLQKQIKQYITACSGVDVKEVRVQVENTSAKAKNSPYAVPEMLQSPADLREGAQEGVASPVDADPSAVPPEAVMPTPEEAQVKDTRPLHQRLFGREEQPIVMPEPPAQEPEPSEHTEEAVPEMDVPSDEAVDEAAEVLSVEDADAADEEEKHEVDE